MSQARASPRFNAMPTTNVPTVMNVDYPVVVPTQDFPIIVPNQEFPVMLPNADIPLIMPTAQLPPPTSSVVYNAAVQQPVAFKAIPRGRGTTYDRNLGPAPRDFVQVLVELNLIEFERSLRKLGLKDFEDASFLQMEDLVAIGMNQSQIDKFMSALQPTVGEVESPASTPDVSPKNRLWEPVSPQSPPRTANVRGDPLYPPSTPQKATLNPFPPAAEESQIQPGDRSPGNQQSPIKIPQSPSVMTQGERKPKNVDDAIDGEKILEAALAMVKQPGSSLEIPELTQAKEEILALPTLCEGDKIILDSHEYWIHRELGSGNMGHVWSCTTQTGGSPSRRGESGQCAVKEIECSQERALSKAKYEIALLQEFHSIQTSRRAELQKKSQERAEVQMKFQELQKKLEEKQAAGEDQDPAEGEELNRTLEQLNMLCMPNIREQLLHTPLWLASEIQAQALTEGWRVRIAMTQLPGLAVVDWLNLPRPEVSRRDIFVKGCRAASMMLRDLAPTLHYLSEIAVHRDVNCRNILVHEDLSTGNLVFNLVDFGLAVANEKWTPKPGINPDMEEYEGDWRCIDIGGDIRYWPPGCWLLYTHGVMFLEHCEGLCWQYVNKLDVHGLGLTALRLVCARALMLPEEDDNVEQVPASLRSLFTAWEGYWDLVQSWWTRFTPAFEDSDVDHDAFRQQVVDETIVDNLFLKLQALTTALREIFEDEEVEVESRAVCPIIADLISVDRGVLLEAVWNSAACQAVR